MSKAEEFIRENTSNCCNVCSYNSMECSIPWLTPGDARKAVEIEREEIYEWLRVNFCNYFDAPRSVFEICLDDLKQAMKDE